MATRYASRTEVPSSKSIAEISDLLRGHGVFADQHRTQGRRSPS
jgi:hypothetical protein